MEREIKTVANVTQYDIREFLPLAAEVPLRPEVTTYRLEEANRALCELKHGPIKGAKFYSSIETTIWLGDGMASA